MKRPYRHRGEVQLIERGTWGFLRGEGQPVYFDNKGDTVDYAAEECRRLWELWGIRSELVIKDRKGRIQDTRTYGDDPRRTKG